MRKFVEPFLFLVSFFGLLGLLAMIAIAMLAPARFTKPWRIVSLLSLVTFLCAVGWLLLGWGC